VFKFGKVQLDGPSSRHEAFSSGGPSKEICDTQDKPLNS